jgi:hypothetical protein
LPKKQESTAASRLTPSRREAIIAQLTRDRDALIKSKREIKMKFDAVESYLVDHTRVRTKCSQSFHFLISVSMAARSSNGNLCPYHSAWVKPRGGPRITSLTRR